MRKLFAKKRGKSTEDMHMAAEEALRSVPTEPDVVEETESALAGGAMSGSGSTKRLGDSRGLSLSLEGLETQKSLVDDETLVGLTVLIQKFLTAIETMQSYIHVGGAEKSGTVNHLAGVLGSIKELRQNYDIPPDEIFACASHLVDVVKGWDTKAHPTAPPGFDAATRDLLDCYTLTVSAYVKGEAIDDDDEDLDDAGDDVAPDDFAAGAGAGAGAASSAVPAAEGGAGKRDADANAATDGADGATDGADGADGADGLDDEVCAAANGDAALADGLVAADKRAALQGYLYQDAVDVMVRRSKEWGRASKDAIAYLEKRIAADTKHAREVNLLSAQLLESAKREREKEGELRRDAQREGMFAHSFAALLRADEAAARRRIEASVNTASKVLGALTAKRAKHEELRKNLRALWQTETKRLGELRARMHKAKDKYLISSDNWERAILARIEATAAARDSHYQRNLDKRTRTEEDARAVAGQSKQAYYQLVTEMDNMDEQFSKTKVRVLQQFKLLEQECDDELRDGFVELLTCEHGLAAQAPNAIKATAERFVALDTQRDIPRYLRRYSRREPLRCRPVEVEDYKHSPAVLAFQKEHKIELDVSNLYKPRSVMDKLSSGWSSLLAPVGAAGEQDAAAAAAAGEWNSVPAIVRKCCAEVDERGLEAMGIYRLSGTSSQVAKLCRAFAKSPTSASCAGINDVHVVAGALKLYFRTLAEPIVPFLQYDPFLRTSTCRDHDEFVLEMRPLLQALPEANRKTLHFLFAHLTRVIEHSEENKMASKNLSIVFGPTLMRPKTESIHSVMDTPKQCTVVANLLECHSRLWSRQENQGGHVKRADSVVAADAVPPPIASEAPDEAAIAEEASAERSEDDGLAGAGRDRSASSSSSRKSVAGAAAAAAAAATVEEGRASVKSDETVASASTVGAHAEAKPVADSGVACGGGGGGDGESMVESELDDGDGVMDILSMLQTETVVEEEEVGF